MFITPHFTFREMTISHVATVQGLDNTPGQEVLGNLGLLCRTLEQVREMVAAPIIVSSGFRSQELNRKIGGQPNSAHTLGLAADFNAVGLAPRELARRICDSDIVFDQLILEFDSWVHLAVSPSQPRREVLTIRHGSGYLPGLQ